MSRAPDPFANPHPQQPQQRLYDNTSVNSERYYDQSGNFDPYCEPLSVIGVHALTQVLAGRREPDQESEADAYSQAYIPSSDNLMGTPRSGVPLVDPHASAQTFTSEHPGGGSYGQAKEPYPAWTTDRQIPLSKE
jgi:1,3-beta-glucan synthase